MLIVAPIVILALGGFISLMVNMVGDVMATHDENAMMYDIQDALTRIEDDVNISNQFMLSSGTLPSPQGSNSNFTGTAAFTSSANSLVLSTFSTTRNPIDPLREIVYFKGQPNPCDNTKTVNPILYSKVIYFINNGSLWRRTYIPDHNTDATADAQTVCAAPWQQNSCSPGYSASRCKANDVKVMSDISAMTVNYYDSPGSTTDLGPSNAENATSIKVTLTGSKTAAGRTVAVALSMRAQKLNVNAKELPPIAFNFTAEPSDVDVIPTEGSTTFNSATNINAATYQWQISTNGGTSWANVTNGANYSGATTKDLTVSNFTTTWNSATGTYGGWNGYAYRVLATYSGQTLTSEAATLRVSNWKPIEYLDDWTDYLGSYNTIGVTKTSAGVVRLKGLVRKPTAVTQYDVIGILPAGYRPSGRLIFQTSTSPGEAGRIDIYPTGEIVYIFGSASWMSLESIGYIPAGTSYTRTGLTFTNGWTNYGSPFENASYSVDSIGRVHVQGLVRPGTITNGTQIATNFTTRPSRYMHVPARSDPQGSIGVDQSLGIVAKGPGTANGYLALHTMWYPSSFAGWTNVATLQNGWIAHDGGAFFTSPGYAKGSDGLVRFKGLIRNGNTANGTVIFTLPAGFRPSARVLTDAVCNPNVECRVDVLANGNVELYSSDAGWTSLDNVTFLAEQ